MHSPQQSTSKLIVASNRLPISITKGEDGKWTSGGMSSGGLVAALAGIPRESFVWLGWAGCVVPHEEEDEVTALLEGEGCAPVFLSDQIAKDHYNGFSNGILWPLFHYQTEDVEFNDEYYSAFSSANQAFADAIERIYEPGDLIWIHDMHLMLLPRMLRKQLHPPAEARLQIGFFLHIPFPTSEVFHVLPWKRELLRGVLDSDLIGFHTYDYASHFLRTCTHVLGFETRAQSVLVYDRVVAVGVFPIGIEPHKFQETLATAQCQKRIEELKVTFKDKKLIIGIDRLDYIKGIPHRLLGYEAFLRDNPDWRGKVVLLQVAVPSRVDVPEYKKLKSEIEKLVGRINGTYGNMLEYYSPVQYLFRSIDFAELTALYTVADICFVTSLRDGMNLVSLEYIVCQGAKANAKEDPGVLILSEFAGASGSLMAGSIVVNPWNAGALSDALRSALTMDVEGRRAKLDILYKYATKYTAGFWGDSFIVELQKFSPLQPGGSLPSSPTLRSLLGKSGGMSRPTSRPSSRPNSRPTSPTQFAQLKSSGMMLVREASFDRINIFNQVFQQKPTHRNIVNAFNTSKKRLIVLEYDGVVVPFSSLPSPSRPPRKVMNTLKMLANQPNTCVYIFTQRDRKTLDNWFALGFHIGVTAENGCYLRLRKGFCKSDKTEDWELLYPDLDLSWRDLVRSLMQHYTIRTPGTFIEETDVQLVWNHRNAEEPFGSTQSRDLHHMLDNVAAAVDARHKRLSVRPLNMTQAAAFRRVFAEHRDEIDFVLVVSEAGFVDPTLELPEKSYVFGIGKTTHEGKWMLADADEVGELLDDMANVHT